MKLVRRCLTVALVGSVAALVGCDNVSGPEEGPAGSQRVSFSVAISGTGSGASGSLSPAFSVTQDDADGNELVIDRVAIVLSEIELEADGFECPEDGEGADGDDDDCEELERGPTLVDFEPGADQIERDVVVKEIPERFVGTTFTELEFEIEVPDEDDGADPAEFLGPGVSVLVEGSFNGEAFTFESDLEAEQEKPVSVEITEGNPETNVTLSFDLGRWFRTGDDLLVDPSTANEGGPNEELVEDNIEDSFDAFEDEDEDGVDEDEDDDEDETGDDADDDGGEHEDDENDDGDEDDDEES